MKNDKNRGFALLSLPSLVVAVVVLAVIVGVVVYFGGNRSSGGRQSTNNQSDSTGDSGYFSGQTSDNLPPQQQMPSTAPIDCAKYLSLKEYIDFFGEYVGSDENGVPLPTTREVTNIPPFAGMPGPVCIISFNVGLTNRFGITFSYISDDMVKENEKRLSYPGECPAGHVEGLENSCLSYRDVGSGLMFGFFKGNLSVGFSDDNTPTGLQRGSTLMKLIASRI
jgi:hypothetical protein